MDRVRQLILERMKALGLKRNRLSEAIGKNETYISQFLVRGVPEELDENDRSRLSQILQVSEDDLRGPSAPIPKRRYEKQLKNSRGGLVDFPLQPLQSEVGAPLKLVPSTDLFGAFMDFPIFGTAEGGQDGALIVTDSAVDYVARPGPLLRVVDGYGIIVTGESMRPEHKSGSVALINPHLPPSVGHACLFKSDHEGGEVLAMIKEYRGQTETHWKVRQHNPEKDFLLKKSEWPICHRAVGNYNLSF